jgi:peptidoglycan/LPS O-acetylase OafA/YrhL
MNGNTIYFPGLNGLRAIASIAVVISHITLSLGEFGLNPFIFGISNDGTPRGLLLAGYGVSIFFVLSGFLITYLLQVEKEYGEISVKKFYLRRILRIWPLYYLYLLIVIFTLIIYGFNINLKSLFFYVFYAANIPFILGSSIPFLAHYWSLGVEEQFYLFWPWLNKKVNSLLFPIFVIFLTLLGIKIILHLFYPNTIIESIINVTRFHCMIIGAMGAILFKQNNPLFIKIINHKLIQIGSWIIVFFVAINKFHVASFIDNEIISFVALFLIIGQIKVANRIINLDSTIFNFLGKISYGIYVIHPILIFYFSKSMMHLDIYLPFKYFFVYFSILIMTIIISHICYKYFEKYFLDLKHKFVVVKSTSVL